MSLPFWFSSKKKPNVFYMKHKFNQHSKNNKGCIHWRCVEYARFKCRAKLVTFENKMLQNSTPVHTHSATKSSAHEQQSRTCDSFLTEAIKNEENLKKRS